MLCLCCQAKPAEIVCVCGDNFCAECADKEDHRGEKTCTKCLVTTCESYLEANQEICWYCRITGDLSEIKELLNRSRG